MEQEHATEHIHHRLIISLSIYVLISAIILGFIIFQIIANDGFIFFPIIGLLCGIGVGILFTRISHIHWDDEAEKVISKLDIYGIILLILYITIELLRNKIIEYFIKGPAVATTSLAVLSGMLFGRVIGMRKVIKHVIEENV